MSDEPIIDEDLEALLYAQLHYGNYSEKDQEVTWTIDSTQLNRDEQDHVETTRERTGSRKNIYPKKRYFENKLVQEDKEKENTVYLPKAPDTYPTERNSNSENSIHSTIESNIAPDISEKSLPEPTTPTQKDQNIESATSQQHQFIQISTSSPNANSSSKDSTQIVTTTVLSTPSEPSHPQLLNNITINQYLFPSDFEQRLKSSLENNPLSKKSKSDLNKLRKGHINEQTFFNNLKKRLRIQKKKQNQNQIRHALLKRQQSIVHSEVICLSDTDSSDIEVVDVANFSKDSKNMASAMIDAADDDEIIYVAPPPVPVISIDTETESDSETSDKDKETSVEVISIDGQATQKESTSVTLADSQPDIESQPDIDENSDDFLQPKNNPDNFNFSLHGSDFQNTEFVRPANPTDVYETESSTSTSDFNRDSSRQFCNTVKTIVFSEVEFPSQDIFDESNLESFGEFITPKRGDKEKRASETILTTVEKSSTSKGSKRAIPRASSESSSESEYEGSHAHQNLPDLSPMLCTKSSPRKNKKRSVEQAKKKKGKIEEEVEHNAKSNKKKLKEKSSEQNDNLDVAEPEQPARKSKRKSSSAVEDEEIPKKKSKKKKNKSDNKSAEDNEDNSASDKNVSCASPKKNVKDTSVTPSCTPSKKAIEDETDLSNVDECKRKSKKKKRHATKESLVNDGIDENNQENTQGTKKKNKKRKKKETAASKIALEANSITNDENEPSKGIDAVTDGSSSNKLSEEQDSLSKKKNKKKKTDSTDNRNSVEESIVGNVENETAKDTETNENESLEDGELAEADENIVGEPQSRQEEEDIIIIEKVIPVHTIESSESSDQDILTFDVGDDIELGNISTTTKQKLDKVIDNKNFDVDYVRSNMSDDPEKWKILPSDRYNLNIAKKGPRCNKCRQFGHISISCPNKPAVPVCTLCGESGHQEPRCPNKVCLTCGKPGSFTTVYCYMCVQQRKDRCNICGVVGHRSDYCPDLWRRYFLTITEGTIKEPRVKKKWKRMLIPRNKQWCSGCASNGHLEYACNSYKWIREYPASTPRIFKYDDVYVEQRKKDTPTRRSREYRRSRHEDLSADSPGVSRPTPTNRDGTVKIVARCLRMLDDNLDQINSQERVTIAEGNREMGEITVESRENINANQVDDRPNIEFRDTSTVPAPTPYEDHNPGANSDRFLGRNHNQPAHSMTSSNQTFYNPDRGQSQTSMRVSGGRGRAIQNRSKRHAKINPVSMMRPKPYTPYHSVLNPYSLMGAPIGPPQQALNQGPDLVQQFADLANAVSRYQGTENFAEDDYNFSNISNQNQLDFYQAPQQFGSQIPSLLDLNVYRDFSAPLIPETHHGIQEPQNVHGNRDFLNIPHTITRDPMEGRDTLDYQAPQPGEHTEEGQIFVEDRERQVSLEKQLEDDFQGNIFERRIYVNRIRELRDRQCRPRRPGPNLQLLDRPAPIEPPIADDVSRTELPPIQFHNSNHNFISFNTAGQENVQVFNNASSHIKVDDAIVRKFNTSSVLQLKELISKDLGKLDILGKCDIRSYKRKLNTIEHLKKIEVKTNGVKKQMYFLFKQINMLLFGTHKFGEGSRNLDYLRHFAFEYQGGVGDGRRKSLLEAYGYIFGGEHPDFNYRRYINNLTVVNKK